MVLSIFELARLLRCAFTEQQEELRQFEKDLTYLMERFDRGMLLQLLGTTTSDKQVDA